MFPCQCQRRKRKAQKVRLNERTLHFPVVNTPCRPYHNPLCEDEGAEQSCEDTRQSDFAGAFHGEEKVGTGGGREETYGADGEGGEGMEEEEGVESLTGEEVV
mmetsp:Transcript_38185/g.80346  ORF Transcript_38185/g.80346 Transcript_38185/m.80346 type:complete len:103 (-) Transcript_38185:433-741(-)